MKVQEMDDTERREARNYEEIASLIGPCLMSNGSMFHMVDGLDKPRNKSGKEK